MFSEKSGTIIRLDVLNKSKVFGLFSDGKISPLDDCVLEICNLTV